MGSWDCYCALCCGPLGIYGINVGDSTPEALARRKEAIMMRIGELERERPATSNLKGFEEGSEQAASGDEEEEERDDDEVHLEAEIHMEGSNTNDAALAGESAGLLLGAEDTSMGVDDDDDHDNEDHDGDDARSESSDLSIGGNWTFHHGFKPSDDMYKYYEGTSYDPRLLVQEDVKWLDRCRTLGYNAEAPGVTKAFISGLGRYDDYGSFRIKRPGDDPNDIGAEEYDCYTNGGSDSDDPTFPFHEACYRVLARHLGYKSPSEIDKDVLYEIMRQNSEEWGGVLNLDYGGPRAEQFWSCQPGEEYLMCSPDMDSKLMSALPNLLPTALLHTKSLADLSHKVRRDPLDILPFDVLYGIFQYLSVQDVLKLRQASWHVSRLTSDRSFWRQMTRTHLSPWFWELNDTAAYEKLQPEFDYKGMFLWLNATTKFKCGMKGPFMGIANRRRIWNVCEQLAPVYNLKTNRKVREEPDTEEAKAVLDAARSLHMPLVMYPQPKDAHTVSAQFIRSWDEVSNQAADLETYFREADGALIGISVSFGEVERVFGSVEGKKGQSMHISAHDWIQEIVVDVREIDMHNRIQDRSDVQRPQDAKPSRTSLIDGLSITTRSGNFKAAKRSSYNSQRAYTVLPGMHLIGLTGEIAADGAFSRLGLLQAPRPGEPYPVVSQYNSAQKALWNASASSVPVHNEPFNKPIWHHPSITIQPITVTPQWSPVDIPPDMRAHQLLQWGRTPQQLKSLTCINAVQVQGGTISRGGKPAVPYYDTIGIRPGYPPHPSLPPSVAPKPEHVGTIDPVPAMYGMDYWSKQTKWHGLEIYQDFQKFDPRFLKTFTVDGAGGEVINSVAISHSAWSIKLETNRGRSEIFGEVEDEGDRYNWTSYAAKDGEVMVGLSVSFGRLSGWSHGAKMWSHWTVSDLGVMLQKVDEVGNWIH